MSLTLLCLPGDGIGPEIVEATANVVQAACDTAGLSVDLPRADIGFAALEASGTTILDTVIDSARAADGVILGPVSHNAYPPVAEGGRNPSGVLRRELELFANIRPARSHPLVPRPVVPDVDMVIVRENLEGFYADRNMHLGPGEFVPTPDVALAMRRVTRTNSRRIAETAFDIAKDRRGQVAVIHKANVLRVSDGLFLEEVRAVAATHPQVTTEELLIDAAAAHMVRDPSRFDVVLATNMYGDILSDLASELAGGLGLGASLNHGPVHAIAQAQHGSAPDIAGQDRANPTALIGSAAMMLDHIGQPRAASLIRTALDTALKAPATRTADLGGTLGTEAFSRTLTQLIEDSAR